MHVSGRPGLLAIVWAYGTFLTLAVALIWVGATGW